MSMTDGNIANRIAAHVAKRFPDLAAHPIGDIWFTGSSVWSLVYGLPSPGHDWDIFALNELAATQLVTTMNWNFCPAFKTREKRTGDRTPEINWEKNIPTGHGRSSYSDGYCYMTPGGEVDVWISDSGSAAVELRSYPIASHSHCRAAFSFTDGLIVLPNENAVY